MSRHVNQGSLYQPQKGKVGNRVAQPPYGGSSKIPAAAQGGEIIVNPFQERYLNPLLEWIESGRFGGGKGSIAHLTRNPGRGAKI